MNRTAFIGTDLYYSQDFVDDRVKELKEKDKEIERLNNIIKEAQEYLRSATHLLLEYNKPFRKVGKYEKQYCKRESDLKRILKGEKVEWGIILDKGSDEK